MSRLVCLLAAAVLAGPAVAEGPPPVAELVKQLGDVKFPNREAAQKELLRRGEAVVPELDRLAKTADAEMADRLRRVRYELVGYKDHIRRLLTEVHEGLDSAPVVISDELRELIAGRQPGSGDVLLAILADPKHALHRRAVRTFVACWDVSTPDQIEAYIRQSVTLAARHRRTFPAKVKALIPFEARLRDGWSGWPQPSPQGFAFRSRTTRYVDGKPYDKAYDYHFPFATIGWIRVGELAEGTHAIHAVLDYEFTHRGDKRTGSIRSKDSTFEVVSADTPDDLIAPTSEALTGRVRAQFVVRESEHDPKGFTGVLPGTLPAQGAEHHWYPQVNWEAGKGVTAGLHCPVWMLSELLDVDLCFDAEIHDVQTGIVCPAGPVILRAGEAGRNWIVPSDVRAFAKGRDGFVKVKVVLKPSRALALSDPDVKRYFPEPIKSDELRMKVYQKVEALP